MRHIVLAAFTVLVSAVPSSGVGIGVGADAEIRVDPDLTACATVRFDSVLPFAGTFTAIGVMHGPGTKGATMRSSIPVVGTGLWIGCIEGGYDGATVGEAKYVVEASSAGNETFEVKQCTVNRGVLICTD